ncbi:AAA domain-containing protein [Providencia vermicola]|uniref:AAA domain-containing protein n=1 Tax=Providencia vermicola TaxID=333965 RepID=UPI0034D79A1E
MNNPIWIGILLWIHRHCIEPMFSLANNRTDNDRMTHADPKDDILSLSINDKLKNHEVVSKGNTGNKQYRDSHGKGLFMLLSRLMQENITLQSIYVITPFNAVKTALIELLKETDLPAIQQPVVKITPEEVNHWAKHKIGAVHTFQGKENDTVIFVLGCSIGE